MIVTADSPTIDNYNLANSLSSTLDIYDFPDIQLLFNTLTPSSDSIEIANTQDNRSLTSLKNAVLKIKSIFSTSLAVLIPSSHIQLHEDPIIKFWENIYEKRTPKTIENISTYRGMTPELFKQKYNVDANSITPPQALSRAGIGYQVYSNFRKGARTRSGHLSYHASGQAWDIGPKGGGTANNFNKMRRLILSNEFMRDWLSASKYGILDETFEEFSNITGATGPHFHFGPDKNAKRNILHWFKTGGGSSVVMTKGLLKTFSWNNTWNKYRE